MDGITIDDPRIPSEFRRHVAVDEDTGCWCWGGPRVGGRRGTSPVFRRKAAWRWVYQHLFGPLPEGRGWPTTCGDSRDCVNPYHRLVEPASGQPHRCSTCGHWCRDSLEY